MPAEGAEREEEGSAARLARIDARLHRLHGSGRGRCLSRLHADAATLLPDPLAQRFHLTHAWVFALVAGDWPEAARLEAALDALPLPP